MEDGVFLSPLHAHSGGLHKLGEQASPKCCTDSEITGVSVEADVEGFSGDAVALLL